jgi:VWFA-related protein
MKIEGPRFGRTRYAADADVSGTTLKPARAKGRIIMTAVRATVACGTALLAAACSFCQLPPSATVSLKVVDLNVVALDSQGRPADDLTADDFQITDAGKPQSIVFFRHNDDGLRRVRNGEFRGFTNLRPGAANATVILFDLFNESPGSRGHARNEIVRRLESLESGDRLYLYLLSQQGRLVPVHGLPTPGETAPPEKTPWTREIRALLGRPLNRAVGGPSDLQIGDRLTLTYFALESLSAQLGALPGRKNVVWISHGVPISLGAPGGAIDYTPELRRVYTAMERANVAIYPVQEMLPDLAEIVPPQVTEQKRSNNIRLGDAPAQYSGMGSRATLRIFADLTGGGFYGDGDTGTAIREAMEDLRTSYQIAWRPAAEERDAKYHKIVVTCRRKGVRLRTRAGYFALPEAAVDEKESIADAVASPFNAAEIGIRLTASPAADGKVRLQLRIDPADVLLLREGGVYTGELLVEVAGYVADGRSQVIPVAPVHLRLTPEEYSHVLRDGVPYETKLALGERIRKVRLIVLDPRLGTTGSMTVAADRLR